MKQTQKRMMKKNIINNEIVMSEIKVNLFQKFSEVAKFEKSVINSVWVWKYDYSLVLSINMKFINLIKVWMKETKLKCDEASIPKLAMSFTIHNECHIKNESTIKTANLMTKYVPANIYCMPIFRTLININLKSIKTYLNSMPQNKC